MLAKLVKLLGKDIDIYIARFCLEKSEDLITTYCNISKVPTKLENICISIAIDIFRNGHYGSVNIEPAIKSIDLGDTKTTYETSGCKEVGEDTAFLKPYLSQLQAHSQLRGWK